MKIINFFKLIFSYGSKDKAYNGKTAVALISGSAGELDWILPILALLKKNKFNIKIIFLTRHARKSSRENKMINDFIYQKSNKIEVILCGSYFFEKIERISYLSHRISIKLNFGKTPIIAVTYRLYDKMLKSLFMLFFPKNILKDEKEKALFISEFPSLRRPRDIWIKQKFSKSIFFYCPHSPHIYVEDLELKYPESNHLDLDKKFYLLLGHPGDYFNLNDGNELADLELEKVFIGHPKYSNNWLHKLQVKAKAFRANMADKDVVDILVLSRGFGSVINEDAYINLIETTLTVIHNQIPNYNLLIKKHPREISLHWDNLAKKYPSIEIVNDHILQLATKSDFVISFWGSGSMDCFSLGVPVIEYWDPNKHYKQQVPEGDNFTTIYRKLGIVQSANNKQELGLIISHMVNGNYQMPLNGPHPFFEDLINRSNRWDKTIKKILLSNKLIDN